MIASVMEAAISSGVEVDHVGDMHDRVYMVVRGEIAEDTAARFREELLEGGTLKIKVLKFGGTSVATADARASAAQRVFDAREAGFAPIAVVSAIGREKAPPTQRIRSLANTRA